MIDWKFNPNNYNEYMFLIPPGNYRIRIEKAEEAVSKTSAKQMIKLTLKVSGQISTIYHYVVLDNSDLEARARTDQKLGQIFDSFAITPGDFNFVNWEGKVGAANVRNKPDNKGEMRAEIAWFIKRSKQEDLPAWQEKGSKKEVIPQADPIIQPEMADFGNEFVPF